MLRMPLESDAVGVDCVAARDAPPIAALQPRASVHGGVVLLATGSTTKPVDEPLAMDGLQSRFGVVRGCRSHLPDKHLRFECLVHLVRLDMACGLFSERFGELVVFVLELLLVNLYSCFSQ